MRIGEAASTCGVTVKAIRFWADQGLLGPVSRVGSYRELQPHHIQRLRIIARCRAQGFSVAEIREVIALLPADGCPSPDRMLALVDAKLAALAAESRRIRDHVRRLTRTRKYLAQRSRDPP